MPFWQHVQLILHFTINISAIIYNLHTLCIIFISSTSVTPHNINNIIQETRENNLRRSHIFNICIVLLFLRVYGLLYDNNDKNKLWCRYLNLKSVWCLFFLDYIHSQFMSLFLLVIIAMWAFFIRKNNNVKSLKSKK